MPSNNSEFNMRHLGTYPKDKPGRAIAHPKNRYEAETWVVILDPREAKAPSSKYGSYAQFLTSTGILAPDLDGDIAELITDPRWSHPDLVGVLIPDWSWNGEVADPILNSRFPPLLNAGEYSL